MHKSYDGALEAAGAEVLEFAQFGSYQGDWWAVVRYQGEIGFVNGAYGSCSGCDALESQFDYDFFDEERWTLDKERQYAEFGESYLPPLSYKEAHAAASQHLEWDAEAQEMVDWIESQLHYFHDPVADLPF